MQRLSRPLLVMFMGLSFVGSAWTQWTVKSSKDAMTDKAVRTTLVRSVNTHSLSSPHQGKTRATFQFTDEVNSDLTAEFTLDRGQLSCGQRCVIRIRFDDDQPYEWTAESAGSGFFGTVYFDSAEYLRTRVKSSQRVRIEANVYRDGLLIWDFRTSNFPSASNARP